MKNLLLLCVALICIYLYVNPHQERTLVTTTPTVAAAAPQGPKVFFHSPLDAGAMPTNVSTGTGYYSTDQDSRFNNYQYHSAVGHGGSAAGGPTSYGAGGSVSNTTIYRSSTSAAGSNLNASQPLQQSYVAGRPANGGSSALDH